MNDSVTNKYKLPLKYKFPNVSTYGPVQEGVEQYRVNTPRRYGEHCSVL